MGKFLPKKHIKFRGKLATRGTCQCGQTLIIEDPDPSNGGKFTSYHEAPLCAEYIEITKNAESQGRSIVDESEYTKVAEG